MSLIESQDLVFDEGAVCTAIVEDSEGKLAATASLFGNVIRMVAVAPEYQDKGLSAVAISGLMEISRVAGKSHLFVYTKREIAGHFASLGFRNIAETDRVSLLEMGAPGISQYRKYLAANRFSQAGRLGAVVMNCNPFTLGHRYLVDHALERCDLLYVIVLETELSDFSFDDRFAMVRAGTADLEARGLVKTLGSGEYAVSPVTFPTYFLKERAPLSIALQQTKLDIDLFCRLFAPSLGINARFIGAEPCSPVTAVYNETMLRELPPMGIDVIELERKRTPMGDPISASTARKMLSSGDVKDIGLYLPGSTIKYLRAKNSSGL
jgi:[citrate (pro-3S)-lyase] ligase